MKPSERKALEALKSKLPTENAYDLAKRTGLSVSTIRNTSCQFGIPLKRPALTLEIIHHFIKVTSSGCWEWQFCKNDKGYGMIRPNGKATYVHRRVWELANHACLLSRGFICHKCDNPPCCNPEHLFLGSAQENFWDARTKGRFREHGYCVKLTFEQVRAIREKRREFPSYTYRKLAEEFNVKHSTIWQIVQGRTWKE